MRNLQFTMTTGETGKVLAFLLEPTDNLGITAAVSLAGWTVTLTVTKGGTAVAGLTDAACDLFANQTTTGKGWASYTFTGGTEDIAPGTYHLRIKGVDGDGNVFYFPNTAATDHAILKVWAA